MEHFVYAIKSDKDKRIYVGISKNPEKRLSEHNKGGNQVNKKFSTLEDHLHGKI